MIRDICTRIAHVSYHLHPHSPIPGNLSVAFGSMDAPEKHPIAGEAHFANKYCLYAVIVLTLKGNVLYAVMRDKPKRKRTRKTYKYIRSC